MFCLPLGRGVESQGGGALLQKEISGGFFFGGWGCRCAWSLWDKAGGLKAAVLEALPPTQLSGRTGPLLTGDLGGGRGV